MQSAADIKEQARRFYDEVFNNKDLDYAERSLADDFVDHSAPPGISPDKAGAMQWFAMMVDTDMKGSIDHVIASGDRVAIQSTFSGTDTTGLGPGVAPTNKPYSMGAIDILRVDDSGRYREHWGIVDVMTAMQQVGLVPTEPPPA